MLLLLDCHVDNCDASGSDPDIESLEQEELFKHRFSEQAVSLQFEVVSALVTLVCPSELSSLKKDVTSVDVVVFLSPESIL